MPSKNVGKLISLVDPHQIGLKFLEVLVALVDVVLGTTQRNLVTLVARIRKGDLHLVEAVTNFLDVGTCRTDERLVEALLDEDVARLLVLHLVHHFQQLLLGERHALGTALQTDDVGGVGIRRDLDAQVRVALDSIDVGAALADDVAMVLLLNFDLSERHFAFQLGRHLLEHRLGAFGLLGRSLDADLVLALGELDVHLGVLFHDLVDLLALATDDEAVQPRWSFHFLHDDAVCLRVNERQGWSQALLFATQRDRLSRTTEKIKCVNSSCINTVQSVFTKLSP